MMHIYTPIFQSIISFLVHALWILEIFISAEAVLRLKEEIIWAFYLNFTHPAPGGGGKEEGTRASAWPLRSPFPSQ